MYGLQRVLRLSSGVKHAALVTENVEQNLQSLTLFGLNTSGQLGNQIDSKHPSSIYKLTFPPGAQVLDLALGRQHTLVLVQESPAIRSLWGAGSNHYGQLLLPACGKSPILLQPLLYRCDVRRVAAGFDHSVLVHEDDSVSTAGWSADGQCGNTRLQNVNPMQRIQTPWTRPLAEVAAGADHTVVRTDTGEVYAWGNAEYGQCCTGEKTPHYATPRRVAHAAGAVQTLRTTASSTLLQNTNHEWWYYGVENPAGLKLDDPSLESSESTIQSTPQHDFLCLQKNALLLGKSTFRPHFTLPTSPIMVTSGFQFRLGIFGMNVVETKS